MWPSAPRGSACTVMRRCEVEKPRLSSRPANQVWARGLSYCGRMCVQDSLYEPGERLAEMRRTSSGRSRLCTYGRNAWYAKLGNMPKQEISRRLAAVSCGVNRTV